MKRSDGFTLIEVMVVLAISSLLVMIAFIGQSTLRERARFDATVNKTVQDINYARNFAMANVNEPGAGNVTTALVAGVGFEFDHDHIDEGQPLEEMEPIYAKPDSSGNIDMDTLTLKPPGAEASCDPAAAYDNDECWEHYFQNSDLDITTDSAYVVYINTGHGLLVCQQLTPGTISISAACSTTGGSPVQFQIQNADHTLKATIQINGQSGLAQRLD